MVAVAVGRMIYPPIPIDPKKDFWREMVRYTIEHHRYQEALRNGDNEHGPWPKPEIVDGPSRVYPIRKDIELRPDLDRSEHYYQDYMNDKFDR